MTYMRFVIDLNAGAVGLKSGPGVKKIARNDSENVSWQKCGPCKNAFLEKWPRKEKILEKVVQTPQLLSTKIGTICLLGSLESVRT